MESETSTSEILLPRKETPELRLTVVETVYYQQPGMDPTQVDAGFSYFVQTSEQQFQRVAFATPEWAPINNGWITKASCVLIQNRHELIRARTPTQEEKDAAAKHEIQVKLDDSKYFFPLRPGESMRFRVSDLTALRIRSCFELTRYICTLIPE